MTSWNPDVLSQIAADEAKYPGSSAVPVMQADGPKAAAVRIAPR